MTEHQIIAIREHRQARLRDIQQDIIMHWHELKALGAHNHILNAHLMVELAYDIESMEQCIKEIAEVTT